MQVVERVLLSSIRRYVPAFNRDVIRVIMQHLTILEGMMIILAGNNKLKVPLIKSIHIAAAVGYANLIILLLRDTPRPLSSENQEFCRTAATHGQIEVLKIVCTHELKLPMMICTAACGSGQLATLQYLLSTGAYWDHHTLGKAAAAGHIHIMKYVLKKRLKFDHRWCYLQAALNNQLKVIEWMMDRKISLCTEITLGAVQGGHIDLVKWAIDHNIPLVTDLCSAAAQRGNITMLTYLRERGAPWDADAAGRAASWNQLETLKWLRVNGAPWNIWVVYNSAYSGHNDLLTWALENGAPADINASTAACYNGRLSTLKILHAHGTGMIRHLCLKIASEHEDLKNWILALPK